MKLPLLRRFALFLIAFGLITSASSQLPVIWQKQLPTGTKAIQRPFIFSTPDGGFVTLTCSRNDNGALSCYPGDTVTVFAKFNAQGTETFRKCYKIDSIGYVSSAAMVGDSALIVGSYNPGGGLVTDPSLTLMSLTGDVVWQKALPAKWMMMDIRSSISGGFFFRAGESNLPFNARIFSHIGRFTSSGTIIWDLRFSSVSEQIHAVHETSNGEVWAMTSAGACGGVAAMHKYTSTGQVIREFMCFGATNESSNIIATPDGGIIVHSSGVTNYSSVSCRGGVFNKFGTNLLTTTLKKCYDASLNKLIKHPVSGYIAIGFKLDAQSKQIGWIAKTDEVGNIEWQQTHPFSSSAQFRDATFMEDGGLLVTALQTISGDQTAWVMRISLSNGITGRVFIDANGNGTKESSEQNFDGGLVEVSGSGSTVRINPIDGKYFVGVTEGTYTTNLLLPFDYWIVNPVSRQSTFTAPSDPDTINFALQPKTAVNDLRISLISATISRPGFAHTLKVFYKNVGTQSVNDVVIKLSKDQRSTVTNTSPSVTTENSDTLSWTIGNLASQDSGSITIELRLSPPPTLNFSDTLRFDATIEPGTGDISPLDNSNMLKEIVRGSYDPNDKIENRSGDIRQSEVNDNQHLSYTIRFQNTGNDTAFRVIIRDTLESTHQLQTLEMIASSHPYSLSVKDDRYLTWTFDNILLPDSNVNEPASHGFLNYRIRPDSNLGAGAMITNTASIYFDFNPPVKTAAAITTIRPERPEKPVISAEATAFCSNAGIRKFKIENLPTVPYTSNATIDNNSVTIASDSMILVDPATMTSGDHKITVTFSNGFETAVTEVLFFISTALTPQLSLSASNTTLNEDITSSTLTATAGVGAGTTPKFTFAKDRDFTAVVRAESAVNTFTVSASDLNSGSNRVYVRLRSSESCVTAPTVIDSINITLDTTTTQPPPPPPPPPTPSSKGFVDPEYPNTIINIFPNPVDDHITIRGLQPSKQYQVRIVSMNGQLVKSQSFGGIETATIGNLAVLKGNLILSLIDQRKKKVIGTTSLVR
jgi:uncharacterized repeat protein (TIGR01451 family)